MSNETRINLKHLLEDIRDSYSSPIEEVIITELVANALDSGASRIDFFVQPESRQLRCLDNGSGMRRAGLKEYHNIAASSKTRGAGIGFAGIGAKLSLLLAEKVITETKGPHRSRSASEWHLSGPFRAPWKYIPCNDLVPSPHGASIAIVLEDGNSPLLSPKAIAETVIKHFFPFLQTEVAAKVLKLVYRQGVVFFVNGKKVELPVGGEGSGLHWFYIFLGKKRQPVGGGYLARRASDGSWLDKLANRPPAGSILPPGLTISTYGKVIRAGWEWVGITPRVGDSLVGIVEIPAMAELLTTNKDNFLSDGAHLKKYYRFRKAIQEAIVPILHQLGEDSSEKRAETPSGIRPLTKQIEGTLNDLSDDFPELMSVVGIKRTMGNAAKVDSDSLEKDTRGRGSSLLGNDSTGLDTNGKDQIQRSQPTKLTGDGSLKRPVKKPGLKIQFEPMEADASCPVLGRLFEDAVIINSNHPAWIEARERGQEEIHIAFSVALILFDFIEAGVSPQEFVSRFFVSLSRQMKPRMLL